jgi:DNA-binding NtrC family response regulator
VSENAPTQAGVTETVLFVDSEVLVRMVICDYLRQCGYKVIEAASGDEAILVLKQADLAVDVVLSDTQMQGSINGFALSQWVRANRPGLDVILVGNPARAANAAGDLCESGPMLAKPYDPQLVVEHIRRLLGARAAGSKRDSRKK